MCVGAPSWGMMSDAVGRKMSFLGAMICTTVFGFATAAAPNYAVSIQVHDHAVKYSEQCATSANVVMITPVAYSQTYIGQPIIGIGLKRCSSICSRCQCV